MEVGRDLWVPLVQPLLQQGHPKKGAQDHSQTPFEDLQGGDLTASLGHLCEGSITHRIKNHFLMSRRNHLFHCLLCCHCDPLKRASLCSLCTFLQVFVCNRSIPTTFPKRNGAGGLYTCAHSISCDNHQ